uniref:Uncharacterized protein n=1 Tax=Ceratitis capitata TaxID=7213 RepID=W8B6C8_CERCA
MMASNTCSIYLGVPVLGTPFGPFSPFGTPTPLLASTHSHSRSPHHPRSPLSHHHPQHPGTQAAFFPPPFLYWSYPSPPVSPTAYYGQPPTHTTTTLAGNLTATPHQAMYSLDFLPAVPPSAISPPSVAIPSPSSYIPPKQYSAQPAPVVPNPVSAATGGSGTGRSGASGLSPYHNKMSLSLPVSQQPTTNIYHYNGPTTVSGSAQPALLSLPPTAANGSIQLARSPILGAPTAIATGLTVPKTTPLTVDTNQHETRVTVSKTTPSANKPTNKIPFSRDVSAGKVGVVPNSCMELYIA